jgi:hypothetical protein
MGGLPGARMFCGIILVYHIYGDCQLRLLPMQIKSANAPFRLACIIYITGISVDISHEVYENAAMNERS